MLRVDLQIERDDFTLDARVALDAGALGIYGPSGCGKTTLLGAIAGLIRPTRGRITRDDQVLVDTQRGVWVRPHRRSMGVVFQDNRLWPDKTVGQNIRYGYRLCPAAERRFEPGPIAALLQIDHLLDRRARTLSGGEMRRVALARAVLGSPRFLLLDEPLTGLDPSLREQVLPFLGRIQSATGIPSIVVSHRLDDLLRLTDTLVVMAPGRTLAQGRFLDLLSRPEVAEALDLSEPVNVLPLRVVSHDETGGLTHLCLAGDDPAAASVGPVIHGAWTPQRAIGQRVDGMLRPRDIALAREPIDGITMQNCLCGRVDRLIERAGRVLCQIDIGVPLLAEITRQAAHDFSLQPGKPVWCLFKSSALRLTSKNPES